MGGDCDSPHWLGKREESQLARQVIHGSSYDCSHEQSGYVIVWHGWTSEPDRKS